MFDLVKAFIAAYQAAVKSGLRAGATDKRWKAVLPKVLVRLAHYKGLDGKFRLFRYGHWIPAQWREFHELYEFARMRGWQREPLAFGAGRFGDPASSHEQEYVKTLLLMRLDSGSFTPDQVEWVARTLEDWVDAADAGAAARRRRQFLCRPVGHARPAPAATGRAPAGALLYPRRERRSTRAIVERMRWLPEHDDDKPLAGELPPREQKLLLMRLAALFGPDALAYAPRAPRAARRRRRPRRRRPAGADARGRRGRAPVADRRKSPGAMHELRRDHADGEPAAPIPTRSRGACAARNGTWSIAATAAAGWSRRSRTRRPSWAR